MKTALGKAAWLSEPGVRLDATYHLSEGRQAKVTIESAPNGFVKIRQVTKSIFYGGRSRRNYVQSEEFGIPFMGSSDMLKADIRSLKYISKKLTPDLKSYFLEKGWTLISRSGTIGNTAYVTEDLLNKAASEHIIRVVPNEKIKPGYLYAFLSSMFGYGLLTQGTFGAVIQHIEPDHIADLPVPLLSESEQLQIHEQIEEASRLRVEANRSLQEAVTFFEGLFPAYDKGYNVAFTKSVSKLGFSWTGRNNEKYADLLEGAIKQKEHFVLSSVAAHIFAPPMFKHIYLAKDNGYPFYTGAHLSNSFRERDRFLSPRGVGRIKDYQVQQGWTLVYKSGPRDGMLGQVFTADKTIANGCLSDHVIRVIIDDLQLSNWVFAFLKSKIGLRLLQNIATGTAILFITPHRLGDLVIPKATNQADLEKISLLVEEYREKFAQAHDLEHAAITHIERGIESWQKKP